MNCTRCSRPISSADPTATMTFCGVDRTLHAQCGREWDADLRDQINRNVRINDALTRARRSLRIVPAVVEPFTATPPTPTEP